MRKKIFLTMLTRAAKAGQKSLVPARHTQRTNQGRTPFHLYYLRPHSPQFQQSSQRPPLSSLSDCNKSKNSVVNGDSKSTNKRGLPWLVRWACPAAKREFCSVLAAPVGPVQNIFVISVHYLNSLASIAQKAGQAKVLGHLSLSMYLWRVHNTVHRHIHGKS